MTESYKTAAREATAEITVKKSRFIANVFPVSNEQEAVEKTEQIRKKYYDARHSCFAYITGRENSRIKYSDDGEPQGTAGIPILDILRGEGLTDILVVVTRYFGGTLLGTGGLVRAYSGAAREGLAAAGIITKRLYVKIDITSDYTLHGKIQYLLLGGNHRITDTKFTDKVKISALCLYGLKDKLTADIVEASGGKALIEEGELCYI